MTVWARQEQEEGTAPPRGSLDSPLTHDLPVHSTSVVTSTRVELALAHVKHVFVLTLNTPPEGTSGVRVVVTMVM